MNWNFYEWELGSEQPVNLVESIPTGSGRVLPLAFDDRVLLVRAASDLSSTALIDLTERIGETAFTFSAGTINLVRLVSE